MDKDKIKITIESKGVPLIDGDFNNRNLSSNLSAGIEACLRQWEKYAQQTTLNDPAPHKCIYVYERYFITIERVIE